MINTDAISLRLAAFVAACMVYGIFASPTPGDLGLVEITVAICLIIAVSPLRALQSVLRLHRPSWATAGQALLVYGLSVPVVAGLGGGHDPVLILRDMIPFGFLLLPLFMQGWRPDLRVVAAAVAFIGVAFALRVVLPVATVHGDFIGTGADPLYLSIAPTISFAAVMCGGAAGMLLYTGPSLRNIALAPILAGCAVLPFAAMVITLQRAGIGLSAFALLLLLAVGLWRKPARAVVPLLPVLVAALCFFPVLAEVSGSLLQKQSLVGNNNRFQEASVVFDVVATSPLSVLFGKGWGTHWPIQRWAGLWSITRITFSPLIF
ncbi:MAG: putative rane protein [Micavibrio sp.]|nr:putative rane protein [Micavibrio sp.]